MPSKLFVVVAILLAVQLAGDALASERPNVIVVMVDDMGYGGVSCFDNRYFETPEIDRLAAEGVRLTDFHSNGSVCSPTRAALMTGRYQQRSGCDEVINADPAEPAHQLGLHDDEWTFAEAMKAAGYATAVYGKWHLGYKPQFNPLNHGFDEFIGFVSGNIDAHSHRDRMKTRDWWRGRELHDQPGYHTDLIYDNALDFIARNQDKPFFLYLAHGTPHSPHQARGSAIMRGPRRGKAPHGRELVAYSDQPGADDWLIRHFILPVDEGMGRLREKLESLGIAENTVVWFLSDNGGTPNNYTISPQTKGAKGGFYEGGHRVPALVWAPGRVPPGSESDELVLTFDIMPTSLAMAGADEPTPRPLDGRDVTPALTDNAELEPLVRFWSMKGRGALRDGDWKLVVSPRRADQLFNLADDSRETTNLAVEQSERAAAMRKVYDQMLRETEADSPYRVGPADDI